MKKKRQKSKNKKNKLKVILIIFFSICLICATSYLVWYFINSHKNKELYEELQNEIPNETTIELQNNEFIDKVKELQKENSDIKGWIRIEDTNISYPLLQTDNNDYYLTHDYKKEENYYGSIFINCNSDLKDNNSNVIIYGHNMQSSGQMFKDLLKYEDKNFCEEHPVIKITTEEKEDEYEIICVFKSRVFYKSEKNVFRYYYCYNFENENEYNEYINNCKEIELYDTGKTASYGEQLITLITCEYSQEDGRMVVVAKKRT